MSSLQQELNKIFDDDDANASDNEHSDDDEHKTSKNKGKGKDKTKAKGKAKQPKTPKPKPLRKTPFIRPVVNNEAKWYETIKTYCANTPNDGDGLTFIDVYGNTGLICYWLHNLLPKANIIMNDSEHMVSKYDNEVMTTYLNGITIEHNDINAYIDNNDTATILLLNPRAFDIKVLEYMKKRDKLKLLVFGSSKNINTDYIYVFNSLIGHIDTSDTSSIYYASETDYLLK